MLTRYLLILLICLIQIPYVFGNDGLDVVFLIDQSASMSGSQSHPTPNDRHGHRISIVKNVVHRLAEQVEGTPLVHRISVVEFGSLVKVPISNLALSYDPTMPPGTMTKNAIRHLESSLNSKEMNNTNTPSAMKAVLTEFRQLTAASTGGIRHSQFLFITDGRPRVRRPAFTGRLIQINQLWRDIENNAKNLVRLKITLWVVGLNDASNYWNSGDGLFWEKLAGHDKARLAHTSFPNIADLVQDIVGEWLNINTVTLEQDKYHSRPYLKRIVFNAHFSQLGGQLSIIDPNGLSVPISAGTPQQETYARYLVDNPTIGTYQLINKNRRVSYKVFVEEELPNLQFLGPLGTTNQQVERDIVFKVVQQGQALDVLPQWPINAQVHVTAPSGATQTLSATFEGDGKFAAAWKPTEIGQYLFDFQGTIAVNTTQGIKQYALVDDSVARQAGSVEVLAYTPPPNLSATGLNLSVPDTALWLHLENPAPEEGLNISPWAETTQVKMSLYQGNNPVTTLDNLVTEPETWLRLEKMDPSGKPMLEMPIRLENGYFVAQLPLQLNTANGEGWWYPGQIHLHVVAASNRLAADRKLNGIWLPKAVEDKRLRGNPMTVAEIEINWSFGWLFLISVVPFLILATLVGIGVRFILPCLSIRGEDQGQHVNLLIYDGTEDPGAVVPIQKLPITGRCSLKLDGQVNVMTESQRMVAEYFRITRTPNPGSPTITVQYRWQGENKPHILRLSGKIPTPLRGMPSGNYMIALGY